MAEKDIRKEITKQETECSWLNREFFCSKNVEERNMYFEYNVLNKEEEIATEKKEIVVSGIEIDVNGIAHGEIFRRIIVDAYKHPAEYINRLANVQLLHAKVQLYSARLISETILQYSEKLCNSIDNLANEIERKNKLDEYYKLIQEIEQYEDTLLELGQFKEAYEQIDLVMIPIITIDEYEAEFFYKYNKIIRDRCIKLAKHYLTHPLFFLPEIGYEMQSDYQEAVSKVCKSTSEVIFKKLSLSEIKESIEVSYASFKATKHDKNFKITDSYIEIETVIETINREIMLHNFRNLHSELRRVVREYKIQQSYKK